MDPRRWADARQNPSVWRIVRAALAASAVLLCAVAALPVSPVGRFHEGYRSLILEMAYTVMDGRGLPGWSKGPIPYSWGGGHAAEPGPSRGTCLGYSGSIRPCPARETVGLDCSGLVRWVYHLAYGEDVLGPGNTNDHLRRLRRVAPGDERPGDLAYFGETDGPRPKTHHVGIYIGDGKMINALRTGTWVRVDEVTAVKGFAGYFRLKTQV